MDPQDAPRRSSKKPLRGEIRSKTIAKLKNQVGVTHMVLTPAQTQTLKTNIAANTNAIPSGQPWSGSFVGVQIDQERAWAEIFRITKPGGTIEHVVPSLEWAAAKVADGQCDEHVMNVMYGAQGSHGYDARYNVHYFGYTKAIAKALAENAGFVDVEVTDWRDREEFAYEILIRGRKP